MESKKDIRKKIFAERKLHTDEQIEAMSRTITDKVTALPAFKNADRILVYADYNHEVVTEYLIKEAWKAGKDGDDRSKAHSLKLNRTNDDGGTAKTGNEGQGRKNQILRFSEIHLAIDHHAQARRSNETKK